MVAELLSRGRLEKLLRDSFANYVVQTALDYADPAQRMALVDHIRPILPMIRNTPYGKRIQSKLQREQHGHHDHYGGGGGAGVGSGGGNGGGNGGGGGGYQGQQGMMNLGMNNYGNGHGGGYGGHGGNHGGNHGGRGGGHYSHPRHMGGHPNMHHNGMNDMYGPGPGQGMGGYGGYQGAMGGGYDMGFQPQHMGQQPFGGPPHGGYAPPPQGQAGFAPAGATGSENAAFGGPGYNANGPVEQGGAEMGMVGVPLENGNLGGFPPQQAFAPYM